MNPRIGIMVEISYSSGTHQRSACSSGKMSLKNRGDPITVATSGTGRRRRHRSVSCYRKRTLLPSREASPVVVAQPSAGAATAPVAGRRWRWGRWRGRCLLLFRASELTAAARTDARAPEVPIRSSEEGIKRQGHIRNFA
jgi:hypothetical protein